MKKLTYEYIQNVAGGCALRLATNMNYIDATSAIGYLIAKIYSERVPPELKTDFRIVMQKIVAEDGPAWFTIPDGIKVNVQELKRQKEALERDE